MRTHPFHIHVFVCLLVAVALAWLNRDQPLHFEHAVDQARVQYRHAHGMAVQL